MGKQNIPYSILERVMSEMSHDIDLLYVVPCVYTRNILLNRLRDRLEMLTSVISAPREPGYYQFRSLPLQQEILPRIAPSQPQQEVSSLEYGQLQPDMIPAVEPAPLQPVTSGNQATLTLQELSRFNGKNGNPAYVAVNGIVYDVTNNAGWAAATHFGLTAGRDLTNEFASCHAGQPLLDRLPVVGKLETM